MNKKREHSMKENSRRGEFNFSKQEETHSVGSKYGKMMIVSGVILVRWLVELLLDS